MGFLGAALGLVLFVALLATWVAFPVWLWHHQKKLLQLEREVAWLKGRSSVTAPSVQQAQPASGVYELGSEAKRPPRPAPRVSGL